MRAIAETVDADAPPAAGVIKRHLRKMNLHCAQDLLNRAYGSPKQSIEQSGGWILIIDTRSPEDKNEQSEEP